MKVIGADIKAGKYEGRDYCNVMIYATYPITSGNGVGDAVEITKIKYDKFCEIRGLNQVGEQDLKQLIGKNVDFNYSKFGQVLGMIEHPAKG